MLVILMIGVSLWITYGILKNDIAIIITNVLSLILNTVVLILRIKYGDK